MWGMLGNSLGGGGRQDQDQWHFGFSCLGNRRKGQKRKSGWIQPTFELSELWCSASFRNSNSTSAMLSYSDDNSFAQVHLPGEARMNDSGRHFRLYRLARVKTRSRLQNPLRKTMRGCSCSTQEGVSKSKNDRHSPEMFIPLGNPLLMCFNSI